jgi:hypothetical protein
MFSHTCKSLLTFAVLMLTSFAAPATAGEAEARAAIAKLLDVGWAVTPQARAAADVQYQEVLKAAGSDTRALEASWLVLMQQHRYDEARQRLDEHLAKSPEDLRALWAKTWVLAVLKNYPAAMLAADKLSALLAAPTPPTEPARPDQDELIGFLGRLMGYFGGPTADSINQDERKGLEKKILDRLEESRKTIFEDARNSVLSKFIEMSDDSVEAKEKAVSAAQADKEKAVTELQADRTQIAARSKDLQDHRSKVQSEFRDELASIARQDQPLVQELARLNSRASAMDANLFAYSADISRLQQLARTERDPIRRQQYLLQADQLAALAARVEADLVAVNRLVQGVQAQRATLAARQAQAQSSGQSQIDRIDRELNELAKRQRRNDGLEKRAARPISVSTSKSRSLSAQATALTTYDSYPLEAAKARLLESLR